MERMCNPGCEAPAAMIVLHNAFINLITGSLGFHRNDQCNNDSEFFDGSSEWNHLPWSDAMHNLHFEQVYHPLYRWLQHYDLNMSSECIELEWMPVELQMLIINMHSMTAVNHDNYWNMFPIDGLDEIDWEAMYNNHRNHRSIIRDMEIANDRIGSFGLSQFDVAFFDHLSLHYSSPCR